MPEERLSTESQSWFLSYSVIGLDNNNTKKRTLIWPTRYIKRYRRIEEATHTHTLYIVELQFQTAQRAQKGNADHGHVEPSAKECCHHASSNGTAGSVEGKVAGESHGLPDDPDHGHHNVKGDTLIKAQDVFEASPARGGGIVGRCHHVDLVVVSAAIGRCRHHRCGRFVFVLANLVHHIERSQKMDEAQGGVNE